MTVEERIAALEKLVFSLNDLDTADSRNSLLDDAKVMAIYSIVAELAERAGVPHERFLKHYILRFRWWHDYYLRQTEDVSPALAAELDGRSIEQASVPQLYPSIFSEPPPDNSDA